MVSTSQTLTHHTALLQTHKQTSTSNHYMQSTSPLMSPACSLPCHCRHFGFAVAEANLYLPCNLSLLFANLVCMHFCYMRLPIHPTAKCIHILFILACSIFTEKMIYLKMFTKHRICWIKLKFAIIFTKMTPKVVFLQMVVKDVLV